MSKVATFAVALVLMGCDRVQPLAPVEPGTSRLSYNAQGGYELVIGPDLSSMHFSNTHVIGREGGRLALGLHELIVPPRAVRTPTVFRMSAMLGPHLVLDLTAKDRASGVAVTSFSRPLELRLSYRFMPMASIHRDRLVVLWLKDDTTMGELVPVPTVVSPQRRYVSGTITHFSQYAMGMN
jgi:hypothetical protein